MKNTLFFFVIVAMISAACTIEDSIETLREKVRQDRSFTITFNSNEGSSVPSQTVEPGSTAACPTDPTRNGYTFDNWYSNAGLTALYDFSTPVTRNITLYAKWIAVPAGSFTVTFNSNGGSSVATQIVVSGGTATRPANPTRSGYTFDNWYSNTGLTTVYDFSTSVTGNITLYAKWIAVPADSFTVTFNSNGGSSVATQTVNSGGTATRPTNPTRSGYTFDNWYSNSGLTTLYDFSASVTGNITLYAKWNPISNSYVLISFYLEYEGAPAIPSKAVAEDTPIGDGFLPTPPTREGFVFGGWWDRAETTQYDATSVFAEDTDLYAKWWITDVLEADDAYEVLYLTNGAAAIYQFDIPEGYTLNDYNKITVDYKVSSAGLAVWKEYGARHVRLYGVYTSATPVSRTDSDQSPEIVYYNLSGNDEKTSGETRLNNGYILDNSKTNGDWLRADVTPNEWFTLEYDTTGDAKYADFNLDNLQTDTTGTVYFGLGIGNQRTDYGPGNRAATFIQLVKNIKLLPKTNAPEVAGVKPVDVLVQFLANNDPIVYEWRAEATEYNIANWRNLVPERIVVEPEEPEEPFDHGDPPANLPVTRAYPSPVSSTSR